MSDVEVSMAHEWDLLRELRKRGELAYVTQKRDFPKCLLSGV